MEPIVLQNTTEEGALLSATFLPSSGMNLISYKKDQQEVIDQTTRQAFAERFSGLGPVIGPHFFRMQPFLVAKPVRKDLFPHTERVFARGQADPYSHGIGRYVPWTYEASYQK